MKQTIYEMGKDGGLVPVSSTVGESVAIGDILQWGGNQAWPQTDYAVIGETNRHLLCFDLDTPASNAHLHYVEFHAVKDRGQAGIWHNQHFFTTGRKVSVADVAAMQASHKDQAAKAEQVKFDQAAERARLEAKGRELWSKFFPTNPTHVIVAEYQHDDSEIQSDYFSSHTTNTVILAGSRTDRNNFSEMRKAAERIPETECYGIGKDVWRPRIILLDDVPKDGCWKGTGSHWHDELIRDDKGNWLRFETESELRAHMTAKGEPQSIEFDGQCIRFAWDIEHESLEHRENYSGGHGYYLGDNRHSGWQIRKVQARESRWNSATNKHEMSDTVCADVAANLARRFDHLTK